MYSLFISVHIFVVKEYAIIFLCHHHMLKTKNTKKRLAPKRDTICVHLPAGYKEVLGKIAFTNDRSMSAMIRRSIDKLILEETGQDMKTGRIKKR